MTCECEAGGAEQQDLYGQAGARLWLQSVRSEQEEEERAGEKRKNTVHLPLTRKTESR
jgi:hypothetical protein